jgi:3-oxoacyl-[acyl-carrier protein] reductase
MLLENKTILITGASRGIGKEMATLFAKEGAHLILLARNLLHLQNLKESLNHLYDTKIQVFTCDVSNQIQVKGIFSELRRNKINIDSVVNNAGIMKDAMLGMATEELMHEIYNINVFGTMFISQQASKFMLKNRNGSIINLASIVGTNGNKGQTVYASSKSAIIGFTKSLSKELATFGIRVNAIAPGFIETDMTAGMDPKFYEKNKSMIGMGRMGKPEDIANVALFLASDLSEYVTGQIIGVDGGFLI